jgi:Ran GTPase-activating protein (RanGAP) involved in mRNA processing and transport
MLERNALSVAYRGLEDDCDPVFEALESFPAESIVSVDLSGNKFTPRVCSVLAQRLFPHLPNLTDLDAKDNKLGATGWADIRVSLQRYCPSLTSLDLSETMLRDEGAYEVALILASSIKLRQLMLVTNHITSRGAPSLCDGLRHAIFLTDLMVDYNLLADEGTVQLCQCIANHPSLTRLGLSDNSIGDRGAAAIATYILGNKASKIQWLNLSVNRIADQGVVTLCSALASPSGSRAIRHIDFSCNPIQAAGRQALCSMAGQMQLLLSLDLCSLELADSDVEVLLDALQRPSCHVTSVEWFNNPLISAGMEQRLNEALERNYALANAAAGRRKAQQRRFLFATTAALAVLFVFAVKGSRGRSSGKTAEGNDFFFSIPSLAMANNMLRPAKDLMTSLLKMFSS